MPEMGKKKCCRCKSVKSLEDFSRNKSFSDGRQHRCKKCSKICDAAYYKKHRTAILSKTRKYAAENRTNIISKARKYYAEHRDISGVKYHEYRQCNQESIKAQETINTSIRSGSLIRPDVCSKCNKPCVPDGHHEDYSKQLDVTWLCRSCHKRLHADLKVEQVIVL